jgi:hypothetical protein
MGLTYHFTFSAPAKTKPEELLKFLKGVEEEAKKLGFNPTMVLNATFDTAERREFARRLTTGHPVEDERLKGVSLVPEGLLWHHGQESGTGRVIPSKGVVLIVTNERQCETIFGFLQHPEEIRDLNGKVVAVTGLGGRWFFWDFVKSPDPRYRKIVKRFKDAGYVEEEEDEYV